MMTGRRNLAAVVLAVSVAVSAAACGSGGTSHAGPSDDPVPASPGSHSPVSTSTSGSSGPTSPSSPSGSSPSTVAPGSTVAPSPSRTVGVATRVAYFSASDPVPGDLHEVVRSRAALQALVGRVAPHDAHAAAAITAGTRATDFSRSVLVAWAEVTGCSRATSAGLGVVGDRLVLLVSQPKPPPECFAAEWVTVVFEVPKERVPAKPVFATAGLR